MVGVACAPFAAIGFLHALGRSGDFGVLGKWYVMVPLAVAGFFAWHLIEKAASWATRRTASATEPASAVGNQSHETP
ncbi:hypothetical protein Adu01nite_41540 [Paractinoplanes durhamensis]|uniref:Uncharacterized protein n=1 Tax=Paractinoplanes durhamensis TaxID=113563 RepID=A0ABQ3YZU2_9ACTN|nr:hypothetical protein Adu01nite_41540 [Actinoplanes durhamensis]